jgi:hypothetical protein
LANAGAAWAAVTVDPRKKASTSRWAPFGRPFNGQPAGQVFERQASAKALTWLIARRRVRFNKHLPTAEALSAWFSRYGRHVRQLHLRHLDAAAHREGCAAAADVAALLRAASAGLRQLQLQHCAVHALLEQHAGELRGLSRLTSLHFQLPPGEALSLGREAADFITSLTNLQDLGLASGARAAVLGSCQLAGCCVHIGRHCGSLLVC